MRRATAIVAVGLIAFAACTPNTEATRKATSALNRSSLRTRAFAVTTLDPNVSYTARAVIQDDFRYKMTLSYAGKPRIEYLVRDDALAVRFLDPGFASKVGASLGHPTVDAALRAGNWVVDPSGAPALFRRTTGTTTTTTAGSAAPAVAVDPFQDTREALQTVRQYIGEARDVKEFSLEDIEYRPQQDPWRYPLKSRGEVRYDLLRPVLPKTEGQASFGRGQSITESQFRKTSLFVKNGRIEEVCSFVDIFGHEDFVALRERGPKSNPYLADLLERIRRHDTGADVDPRDTIIHVDYPTDTSVELPGDAVIGKLETFNTAFQTAIKGGLLKPAQDATLRDCRRPASASG